MPHAEDEPAGDRTIRFDIVVSRLPTDGLAARYEASEADRAALAAFLGILAVDEMSADIRAARRGRDMVTVKGRLKAEVAQASVITLDPVPQTIDEEIDLLFVADDTRLARRREANETELHLDPEEDLPETFSGDRIDLGDYFREIVALALDPYPRGAGADFDGLDTDPDPSGGRTSPFASLTRLKPDTPPD